MKKLPTLAVFAAVLVLAAVGAWLWSGNEGPSLPTAEAPDLRTRSEAAQIPPGGAAPAPSGIPPSEVAVAPAKPPAAGEPLVSSVVPGAPMVRASSEPPKPVVAAPPAARGEAVSPPAVEAQGRDDLDNVQLMLRDFRTRLGENPVGSNAEIMKTVMGGNPANARLGPPTGQSLNEQGELVDRWGTAYFFHQISSEKMEIRSAGPDRTLYTSDDLLAQ